MDKTIHTQADGISFHDHNNQPRLVCSDDSLLVLVWILNADDYWKFQLAGGKDMDKWTMTRDDSTVTHYVSFEVESISPTHVEVHLRACIGDVHQTHANIEANYVFTRDDWTALLDLIDAYFKQQNQ